ncbi:HK97 family phage prohead protease [Flavobacterium branchiophilum]|uniref:Phage prohead protease n=1 Tax=Flavobacterium branchiophilum TaxID=55197 RepID=A0A2H3KAR9_9FLAO|nr:phage prohead protease [Flavobacterium branchiophilum]PDS23805.1 phage prohead protease [Flavobacterium branchiophilum]
MSKHTFLVSDESVNSYGFKVLTNGIDTARFETNPIMLYMHERPKIIGKWENLRKENNQLFADAVFDVADATASEIAGKVERGFLKCASIGIGKVDLRNDVVSSCELFEISIVDIGSNSNALRLYTDTETTIQLKLNELTASHNLTTILGLAQDKSHTEIVAQVKSILAENKTYKSQLETIRLEQKAEAEIMIDDAIDKRLINPSFKQMHLKAFETDYDKARTELANLYPFKRVSLVDLVNNANSERLGKGKESWSLEDYRKFAPKELEANPELFQRLVAELK